MDLLMWYNAPFSMMVGISFFFLMLQFIGGDSSESELDVDTDIDVDVDLDMDVDVDIDTHIGFSKDFDFEAHHPQLESGMDLDTGNSPSVFLNFLGFVNAGRVPLSILLMTGFFSWGALGLLLNSGYKTLTQGYPSYFFPVALTLALVMSVWAVRFSSRAFGSLFKETNAATQPDDLVGCVGQVASGQVPEYGQKNFGRANVYSAHGTLLRVNCITHPNSVAPGKNQTIFVTGYDPQTKLHTVLLHESDDFHAYLSGNKNEMYVFEQRLEASKKALNQGQ